MRKIFAILTALLLVSCSMNHDEVVVAMKATQSTKISKEQALKNLYSELKLIDGATRADGTLREVKSIKPLVGAVTRSGNTLDNDLLYIVEFGEGQGSAVVAADTRLEPVIAVLDTDVLTAEDFANDDMNDISAYMASLIEDYAEGVEKRDALPLIPANPTNIDTLYTVIAPMLKTKWHQQAPYNNLCFDSNGNQAVAGCAPIAAAQLIYYLKPFDDMVINNTAVSTKTFSSLEYPCLPTNVAKTEVAIFVRAIGGAIGASYGVSSTGANTANVANLMQSIGFTYIYRDYSESLISERLQANVPTLIRGTQFGQSSGHAWVIDGQKTGIIYELRFTADGGADRIEIGVAPLKLHCNFGWGGYCDGYYIGGLFNTSRVNNDADISAGDIKYTAGYNFTSNFKMIY